MPEGLAHQAKVCRSCGQPIFWAQNVETGRSMPIDVTPTAEGNVVLYDRKGRVVSRVLNKGENLSLGEVTRTSHFVTCPYAKQHRRRHA